MVDTLKLSPEMSRHARISFGVNLLPSETTDALPGFSLASSGKVRTTCADRVPPHMARIEPVHDGAVGIRLGTSSYYDRPSDELV